MLKHIELKNKDGKTLRGYLNFPVDCNGILVLMYHGFTGNKTEHGGHFRDFARLLANNNIASLRMDFSGNGESDGSFPDFTFDTMISEAHLLLDYCLQLEGVKEVVLLGFSMGGAIAAYIASKRPQDVSKLLLWSPAGNIVDLIKRRFENNKKLENGNVDLGNFELSKEMYASLDNYDLHSDLDNYKKLVYIIHGKKDLAVDYSIGEDYARRFSNSKIRIIESAGHGYDRREEKQELLNESLKFLKG